jgi:hypothetical protein
MRPQIRDKVLNWGCRWPSFSVPYENVRSFLKLLYHSLVAVRPLSRKTPGGNVIFA